MKIVVTPEYLERASTSIDSLAGDYETMYNQLFSEVSGLQSGWQGKDNVAFTNQIEGFRDNFEAMHNLMVDYATFLKNAATNYSATQDAIAQAATQLAN